MTESGELVQKTVDNIIQLLSRKCWIYHIITLEFRIIDVEDIDQKVGKDDIYIIEKRDFRKSNYWFHSGISLKQLQNQPE